MGDALEIVGDAGSVAADAIATERNAGVTSLSISTNKNDVVSKVQSCEQVAKSNNDESLTIALQHPGKLERMSKRSILSLARLCVRVAGSGSLVLDPLFSPLRSFLQIAKQRRRAALNSTDGGRRTASLALSYSPSHLALPYELKLAEENEEDEEEETRANNGSTWKKTNKHKGTRVVVVGGGIAGLKVFHELKSRFSGQKWFDVTLVDEKSWHEYAPGVLREIVRESGSLEEIAVRFPADDPDFCLGHVAEVREDCVLLSDGRELGFEILVLASGSRYDKSILPSGFSKYAIKPCLLRPRSVSARRAGDEHHDDLDSPDREYGHRAEEILAARQTLSAAKRVLVVGGGLVGVELAAELIDRFGEKQVTLLHSGKRLCPSLPEASTKYIDSFFKKRGVEVITGAHMLSLDEHACTYTVEAKADGRVTGNVLYNDVYASEPSSAATQPEDTNPSEQYQVRSIHFDLCVECTGTRPNSEMMLPFYGATVDESGRIRVNDLLQVELCNGRALEHIFAVGDVSGHTPSVRYGGNALYADLQAGVVVHNISTLLELDTDEDSVQNCLADDTDVESLFMRFPESLSGSFARCPRSSICSLGEIDASLQVEHLVLNGFSAALAKLLVDELQMLKNAGNPLGRLFYKISDKVLCYLFREDGGLLKHPRRAIPSFSF